ncbi:YajG family lipoprotein [Ferrimonas balearica]|uniref:YajG family lipoprotein n=1 Tax=Ferrimonas balearica TaxID=44012 RepID=UPI001C58DCC1|nr:YajG family lipoprotein [Ferrimonas balearica]MBW3164442.1 YajG family lipoprotein [Ferrimonas balearica]
MKKLLLAAAVLLGGCASHPQSLIIAPTEPMPTVNAASSASVELSSTDHRTDTFLVRIHDGDGPAQLINASSNPRALLESGLRDGLSHQGYAMSGHGTVRMALTLEELQVDVDQSAMRHIANSRATATLVVEQDNRQLVKRYQARGEVKGVLKVESSVLEREVNDRLNQLLNAMLNDPELHQFIQ